MIGQVGMHFEQNVFTGPLQCDGILVDAVDNEQQGHEYGNRPDDFTQSRPLT